MPSSYFVRQASKSKSHHIQLTAVNQKMIATMLMFIFRCSHQGHLNIRASSQSCAVAFRELSSSLHSTNEQVIDSGKQTSLLWLSANRLRLRDNAALTKAAELGPDGLGICVTWPYGTVPTSQKLRRDEITPVEAFGLAALNSLNDSLGELGQKLWLIPSEVKSDTHYDPISVIADVIQRLQPSSVVVDTCLLDAYEERAARLRDKLSTTVESNVIEVLDEGLLIDYTKLPKALGRSRGGGRALRWSTFLSNALSREEEPNGKATWSIDELPPPFKGFNDVRLSSSIPTIQSFPLWARGLLSDWGEVSEEEAIRRANSCTIRHTESNPSYQLSERGSKDSKLSPYLRFGMISPRRAAKAGVRKRDLLWRDWSHICYGLLNPLRRGEPVLEYIDQCNKLPDFDTNQQDLLTMWVVGNTGSQLVDAGMRQLWREGWMPRKIRLLAAACLVEGMGVDWRLGRDWFKYTLIDHDPAINELMWQNAGLVGVDPFYNGIAWEATASDDEEEYVEKWTNEQLDWPPHLKPYAEKQPDMSIVSTAKPRRDILRANGVYAAARTVSNSGVRVAWPGLAQQNGSTRSGDVLGVGVKPVDELRI